MSVGHVARGIEEAGIPTVAIVTRAFRHRAEEMSLPRTLVVRHLMGRPMGAAHDVERQTHVLYRALELLESATANGAIVELEEPYRPGPGI